MTTNYCWTCNSSRRGFIQGNRDSSRWWKGILIPSDARKNITLAQGCLACWRKITHLSCLSLLCLQVYKWRDITTYDWTSGNFFESLGSCFTMNLKGDKDAKKCKTVRRARKGNEKTRTQSTLRWLSLILQSLLKVTQKKKEYLYVNVCVVCVKREVAKSCKFFSDATSNRKREGEG